MAIMPTLMEAVYRGLPARQISLQKIGGYMAIEKYDKDDFRLFCDHCGDECDEIFETFQDAVDFKVDRDNGWASVKDKDGVWNELCPSCNKPEIIAKLKGIEHSKPMSAKTAGKEAARLASLADQDFEDF